MTARDVDRYRILLFASNIKLDSLLFRKITTTQDTGKSYRQLLNDNPTVIVLTPFNVLLFDVYKLIMPI